MSDALILAETLDALATLSEDTNGRELRTLRDAARTIREQHAALAKREAVAVIVPYQNISTTGAEAAGPVMKCVIEGALAINQGLPASGTATTCK